MRPSLRINYFVFTFCFAWMTICSFAQGQNGFNIQSKVNKSRIVFIPEDTKIKLKLDNGNEITGNLTGADSNSIFVTRNNGKQKAIAISSINKMTVFHPHDYFTLLEGMTNACIDGCGNGCTVVGSAIVLIGVVAITAGELIFDGIADVANDKHYDLQNNWKIIGPVIGR